MPIKKVWIEPGCITCGACEFIAPEIFEVTDVSRIKPCALSAEMLQKYSAAIQEAAQACPVNVIKYQEE